MRRRRGLFVLDDLVAVSDAAEGQDRSGGNNMSPGDLATGLYGKEGLTTTTAAAK